MKKNWFLLAAFAFFAFSCGDDEGGEPKPESDGTGTPEWTTYKVLDTKTELGFYMLDRNVGATEAYNGNSKNPNAASIGYYYQFGKNLPIKVNADGTISNFDKEWNGEGAKDWTKGENTPCPAGWRIPTMTEAKKIADKAWADYDWGTQTEEEFEAAKALYKKLLIARNGIYRIVGTTKADRDGAAVTAYLPAAGYFWSNELNVTTDGAQSTRGFKQAYAIADNVDILLNKKSEINEAMPIRCIKDEK